MKSRIVLIFVLFLVMWLGMILRGSYLQLVADPRLEELQKKQFETMLTVKSRRGAILDRDGRELAVTVSSYSLFADPKIIKEPKTVARKVAKYLGADWRPIYKKIKNRERRFVWLRRHLSRDQKESILDWKIRGLGLVEEPRRIYPNNSLLASALGFVGSEGQGLEGLELAFERHLKGQNIRIHMGRDARGRPLMENGNFYGQVPDGFNIHLTIDNQLQYLLERELEATQEKYEADSAVGVVLDARTSEILAMGQTPGFNLNNAGQYPHSVRRNRSVTDAFEPGSTMKTFVMASALKHKVAKPNTAIDCEGGKLQIGRRIIREADSTHNFGQLTVSEILAYSSNVGTAKLAFMVGNDRLYQTLLDFGFGSQTLVDLPGESSGILHKPPWNKHLLANISFGHGVSATPLQIAAAYGAIANGGVWSQPYIVKRVISEDTNEEVKLQKRQKKRVLSQDDAATLTLMLTNVTAPTGTGFNARIKGFPVAGKTGTAQKVNLEKGGYFRHAYISSFAGFVPANDPRFVIYIAVDNPRVKYYGAQVAAPVFARLASFMVRKSGLPPVLISEENILATREKALDSESLQEKALTAVNESMNITQEGVTPDFRGLTLREVIRRVRGTDVKVRFKGSGVVASSRPTAGEPLRPGQEIHLQLKTPKTVKE